MIDWRGQCRLALVVSVAAGAAALLLAPVLGETTVIVSIIVGATCVSWFHLERDDAAPAPAPPAAPSPAPTPAPSSDPCWPDPLV